jgi:glycerophosphoryl diester phosphodiesterase
VKQKAMNLLGFAGLILAGFMAFNASFWASAPVGTVGLVASGTTQRSDGCALIRPLGPNKDIMPNTAAGIARANKDGAFMAVADLAMTRDRQLVLIADEDLSCQTEAKGRVGDTDLAHLRALGNGQIPTVTEALYAARGQPLLFRFRGDDPQQADLLVAAIRAIKRDPAIKGYYTGAKAPVERMRALVPGAQAFTMEEARACTAGYSRTGWFGLMPAVCKGSAYILPYDATSTAWGWPRRLIQRMAAHKTLVIVTAPASGGIDLPGLTEVDQLGSVAREFNGLLIVDEISTVGPALIR